MNERMIVDRIFDAAIKASAELHREDRIRRINADIRTACERRCGNCHHWMKNSCVPEKQHKQRKSMNSIACRMFERDRQSVEWENKLRQKLSREGNAD